MLKLLTTLLFTSATLIVIDKIYSDYKEIK